MEIKKVKVLIVGQNYASVMNSLAYGLKQHGLTVKAVSFENTVSKYNNYDQFSYKTIFRVHKRFIKDIIFFYHLMLLAKWTLWADIVHVYVFPINFSRLNLQLRVIKFFARKKFVTFLGSEVRRPEITKQHARYFEDAYADQNYEYRRESEDFSFTVQKEYKGFSAIVWDVGGYLFNHLFRSIHIVPHASKCGIVYQPITKGSGKLKIIHAPSAPVAKGSKHILPLMESLAKKYDFIDFEVVENVSNEQYQLILSKADILIDQVVWGAFGVASQQAMELGKIVFAHISHNNEQLYGADCPVVNITFENLEDKILEIYKDDGLKKSLSEASRSYYLKQFDPNKVAAKIKDIYLTN